MREVHIAETRSHVMIVIEDADRLTREVIELNYREAAGLKHKLDAVLANPHFHLRDPKSKNGETYERTDYLRPS
jgi:hypothetical protein